MYAAVFEMTSWRNPVQYLVQGETPADLLDEFEQVQSLRCLVRMGRGVEKKAEGRRALELLEDILYKRDMDMLTAEDLLALDIKLSLGDIRCAAVMKGEDAAAKLAAKYPNARR